MTNESFHDNLTDGDEDERAVSATARVIRERRKVLGLKQPDLARLVGVDVRQIARYESLTKPQEPTLPVAVRLAEALGISMLQLAGIVTTELDLSGDWWAAWQTWKDGIERVDVHELTIRQDAEWLQLDGSRARPVEDGSYEWLGELRLWDNEALMGWYRANDGATRSKGTIYFALHPHGDAAAGAWTGLSYEGLIVVGWGAMARRRADAEQLVHELTETEGALRSWPPRTPT